jgi:hypothetical protein
MAAATPCPPIYFSSNSDVTFSVKIFLVSKFT